MAKMTRSYPSQILGRSQPSCSKMPPRSSIPVCRMACRPRTQIKSTRTCLASSRVNKPPWLNNNYLDRNVRRQFPRRNNYVFQSLAIHQAARCDQLDWDRVRLGGCVWVTGWSKTQRMDRPVSDHHRLDEPDRIFLSVSRCDTRDRCRNHFFVSVGGRDRRPIFPSSCWRLALDLRGHGDDLALSECLRSDRATLSEGAGPESFGANTDRAAICCHATCCADAVRLAHDHRRDQVSRGATSDGLT